MEGTFERMAIEGSFFVYFLFILILYNTHDYCRIKDMIYARGGNRV
jgi:hypothetical protein